jgi:hypothetical protein
MHNFSRNRIAASALSTLILLKPAIAAEPERSLERCEPAKAAEAIAGSNPFIISKLMLEDKSRLSEIKRREDSGKSLENLKDLHAECRDQINKLKEALRMNTQVTPELKLLAIIIIALIAGGQQGSVINK